MNDYLEIMPLVGDALAQGRAVVALESTIISHGLPWPKNLEVARAMESAIKAEDAVPATIAILGGKIKIGIDDSELEYLARAKGVRKVSRRDIALCISNGEDGATTVAGTMVCAEAAGIEVFATGGIGGVHRGAEDTFDISADLAELARTNVAVVCSGAKSILDLAKTLEVLETLGVPVIGFATDAFPAFYTRGGDLAVDQRLDDVASIAAMLRVRRELGLTGGVVIANPIPADAALDNTEVESWITIAEGEAAGDSILGKDLTPYLLSRLSSLSNGRTLAANMVLAVNNAAVAGRIAVALADN